MNKISNVLKPDSSGIQTEFISKKRRMYWWEAEPTLMESKRLIHIYDHESEEKDRARQRAVEPLMN
jgi:hypothetical protein